VGSTTLSQQLDPEELREVMQQYQAICTAVIQRYAGYIAQRLGDGMLVYFGYPVAHEDDAQRAVHAGIEIIAALRVSPLQHRQLPIPLQVRIGIHTGGNVPFWYLALFIPDGRILRGSCITGWWTGEGDE
jgi:class 3 adenylate cyclase